jgi:hypothetical protein
VDRIGSPHAARLVPQQRRDCRPFEVSHRCKLSTPLSGREIDDIIDWAVRTVSRGAPNG